MVQQAADRVLYLGEAEDQVNNKHGKPAESQEFMQQVLHQIIESSTLTASVSRRVKQHAEKCRHQRAIVPGPQH